MIVFGTTQAHKSQSTIILILLCFVARLFADVLNDVAIFLEIVAPFFQQYFRLIVCTAGVSKVWYVNKLDCQDTILLCWNSLCECVAVCGQQNSTNPECPVWDPGLRKLDLFC